jgi:hypothetical protein
MSTPEFQADRREALRRQLVELPTLAGAEDPVRYRPPKSPPRQGSRSRDAVEHETVNSAVDPR